MTDPRICSVDGCGKPVLARGWCSKHYQRIKNGGSLDTRIATSEERREFIQYAIDYARTDCLLWPYGKSHDGRPYLNISLEGKKTWVSINRIICEAVNGPPASLDLHAAHSCGKGHLGCVNGKHLYWATASKNSFDRVDHGTMIHGNSHHWSKLTEEKVMRIKQLINLGIKDRNIAEEYNVCTETISHIRWGNTWKHVQLYYDL